MKNKRLLIAIVLVLIGIAIQFLNPFSYYNAGIGGAFIGFGIAFTGFFDKKKAS